MIGTPCANIKPLLYEGQVTRRDDPQGLGRVKVMVPAIIEPESPGWAWPLGIQAGGAAKRGTFEPPAVGATVGVLFKLGSIDHPYYLTGPWGAPGGVSDVPTGAEVQGDRRQNAVTEDEEWVIERDSRSESNRYLIKHKSSSTAVLIDGNEDRVQVVRQGAGQAFIRGTEYREAEVQAFRNLLGMLNILKKQIDLLANSAGLDLTAADVPLDTLRQVLAESRFIGDREAYLSERFFGE